MSRWTVLLIGGAAAVGKTTAAKRIAAASGAMVLQADDVWLALQAAIRSKDDPALHAFSDSAVWRRPVPELLDLKRAIAVRVSAALEPVVGHHLRVEDRLVIEGVWITPAFAARTAYAGNLADERRRPVFVVEDDPSYLRESMVGRGRGFGDWPEADRRAMIDLQAAYGRWLRAEVDRHSLPCVSARPVDTLADRIVAVL